MAEKKATQKAETESVNPITLKDDVTGKIYLLEFNRDSIKFAEARKFNISDFGEGMSISAIEDLFFYSFRMHQPNMSKADTDKILYEKLGGMPEGMIERLVDLYLIPFNALVQTGEKGKNSTMTVTF